MPGSTARVNSVPSDGAINVSPVNSAPPAPVAPAPVRGWLRLSDVLFTVTGTVLTQFILSDFSVACAWSREERAFSRSFLKWCGFSTVLAGGYRSSAHSIGGLRLFHRCGGLSDFFIANPASIRSYCACATETPAFACSGQSHTACDPVRPVPGPL